MDKINCAMIGSGAGDLKNTLKSCGQFLPHLYATVCNGSLSVEPRGHGPQLIIGLDLCKCSHNRLLRYYLDGISEFLKTRIY